MIDFSPDGGWRDRGAFRWEFDAFRPRRAALERAQSAQGRTRAVLLGEMQATVDAANEAVRRMSGSQREREAQPSSEIVHHIVKSEVNERISRLEAKVDAGMSAMNAKLDLCISAINELSRERQAVGRPDV